MITTRLSSKGQVVLPKKIRDNIEIKQGTVFQITVALTQSLNATIVTGDPEIISLDDAIRVEKLERYKLKRH
jgi:AbrB family looped-hinge helix DNA binding protein